ncbi:MAG: hypothetical protein ACI9WC_001453 [Arenicella sp.]|jgi:hypothetical protein
MKVRLRDIKVASLNSCTIIVMTKFIGMARTCEGVNLQIQQPDAIKSVFLYGARTNNPDLIVLFMRIKMHMIKHLHNTSLINRSVNIKHRIA